MRKRRKKEGAVRQVDPLWSITFSIYSVQKSEQNKGWENREIKHVFPITEFSDQKKAKAQTRL